MANEIGPKPAGELAPVPGFRPGPTLLRIKGAGRAQRTSSRKTFAASSSKVGSSMHADDGGAALSSGPLVRSMKHILRKSHPRATNTAPATSFTWALAGVSLLGEATAEPPEGGKQKKKKKKRKKSKKRKRQKKKKKKKKKTKKKKKRKKKKKKKKKKKSQGGTVAWFQREIRSKGPTAGEAWGVACGPLDFLRGLHRGVNFGDGPLRRKMGYASSMTSIHS